MIPRFGVFLLLSLSATALLAEPPATDNAIVETPRVERALPGNLVNTLELKKDVIEKKHFRITGPLVHPFKGRLREAPRKLLHVINPFASTNAEEESGAPRASAQAWTTAVGWSTGPSGGDPAMTHESKMGLVTLGR